MTIKLYTLNHSTSSKKARGFLESKGLIFVEQSMSKESLSWEQLFEILMHTENGVEDILSLRSVDYRELVEQGIDFDELTLTELHYVVQRYPKLLRVPIIVTSNMTMVGYNNEKIQMLSSRGEKKKSFLEMLDRVRADEDKEIEKMYSSKRSKVIAV